jgi:hypothetical protein
VKRVVILIATAITTGAATASWACGSCVEDRVAATYDHAVIHTAIAKHQQVVFVAIDGPGSAEKIDARIMAAASKVRGVKVGTLRTSVAPQAFSFALDAAVEPESAVSGFRKAIGDSSAQLTLVRIMRNGALVESK